MARCPDSTDSKLQKPKIARPRRKTPENIFSVQFNNQAVELTNLPQILNHTDLTHTLKGLNKSFITPTSV